MISYYTGIKLDTCFEFFIIIIIFHLVVRPLPPCLMSPASHIDFEASAAICVEYMSSRRM